MTYVSLEVTVGHFNINYINPDLESAQVLLSSKKFSKTLFALNSFHFAGKVSKNFDAADLQ
jgi:hypothetical protein